jgi:molybdopterin-guanine dinucleotide biosynthesis protein MobB
VPPVISIVGRSKSGKTTLIEKLLAELIERGYHVATIKHTYHEVDLDKKGKDTRRHIDAGSSSVVLSSPVGVALIKPVREKTGLGDLVRMIGEDVDLVIAEGFKQGDAPKIEVHRKESGPILGDIKKLIAIATDEPLESKARQFSLDDIEGLADLIEKGFVVPHLDRTSLYINNLPVELSNFPKEFITSTLLGMVSSLKGVGDVESMDISLRRRKGRERK